MVTPEETTQKSFVVYEHTGDKIITRWGGLLSPIITQNTKEYFYYFKIDQNERKVAPKAASKLTTKT